MILSQALLILSVIAVMSSLLLAIYACSINQVYAQSLTNTRKTTNGGAVDIVLQPSSEPIKNNAQTQFKVTFFQKGTNSIQPHIDYDFVIIKDGKEVFSASNESGQPGKPLHTAESVVTIPYNFRETGNDYSIKVSVFGILFNPIKPESAEFPIKVTPEFPGGIVAGALAILISAILVVNKLGLVKSF